MYVCIYYYLYIVIIIHVYIYYYFIYASACSNTKSTHKASIATDETFLSNMCFILFKIKIEDYFS